MENSTNILVFATNIRTENDKQLISKILNQKTEIRQWNIDQEDIDCVLRIESDLLSEEEIINIIDAHDFDCTPLE
ncbi:hypothetical protein GON26_13490 [Flavobacterium sp. GA093]|uniref:Uncharacterized protein n=1 Tax=Flavobacterium hydrocarbonoxydans TaxID=2683249 RepID=A0A6I4NWD8_9FLAO|nr:hypothetical protein [Flavobacterium hydrocarbonoxydans]MWB95377.1 hypothetical protein [Flavobacterium hydrocarbonoxydans]